jgi:hypothetical protein
MTNTADLNHLEYARPIPNSTSYGSSLDVGASPENKDSYGVTGQRDNLEPPTSLAASRRASRETHVRLNDAASDEPAVAAVDEPRPEESNLFKMMIADAKALIRIFKTMSWKEFFKTMTKRYLWSECTHSIQQGPMTLVDMDRM